MGSNTYNSFYYCEFNSRKTRITELYNKAPHIQIESFCSEISKGEHGLYGQTFVMLLQSFLGKDQGNIDTKNKRYLLNWLIIVRLYYSFLAVLICYSSNKLIKDIQAFHHELIHRIFYNHLFVCNLFNEEFLYHMQDAIQ